MKILVIGSGAREHALVWKLAQSPHITELFCAPGNAGIADLATCVDIASSDCKSLLQFAQEKKIDLTIVGPEQPLSLGIVDLFESHGLKIFGPNQRASQFESSKAYSKNFMKEYGIPTADYREFTQYEEASKFVQSRLGTSLVIKADGLAAGKGVRICGNLEQAEQALKDFMQNKIFGESGARVVVEEFLEGEELSYLILCDGKNAVPLASSQDHKTLLDHNQGPNTGGMGAFSPSPLMTPELEGIIQKRIVERFLSGCEKEGIVYQGVLYVGLMVVQGEPYVLEFNVRFGDPETQALMMRLDTDLVELFQACVKGELSQFSLKWKNEVAVCVVMVSHGYPENYQKGFKISGLDQVKRENIVFHAGTKKENGDVVTNGGRVLCVGSLGQTLQEASEKTYEGINSISWEGVHYRKDIGRRKLI